MQVFKRMGRGGTNPNGVTSIIDSDVDVEFSQTVQNPMQPRTSSAYRESLSRSREASISRPDSNPVNHHVRPGMRTILSAVILFTGGIILLILGTVVFFDTSTVVSKDQGLDMLIIGAVMLLPGSYGVICLFGAWMRWRGYSYDSMPLLD